MSGGMGRVSPPRRKPWQRSKSNHVTQITARVLRSRYISLLILSTECARDGSASLRIQLREIGVYDAIRAAWICGGGGSQLESLAASPVAAEAAAVAAAAAAVNCWRGS